MAIKTLVNFIQDRSGSMGSCWDETVNGFKEFIKSLQQSGEKDGVEYLFSLTVFDTQVDTPLIAVPIKDVKLDALDPHGPRGSTALYDAVGLTIKNTEDNRHGSEKIIVVIVTDGQENSSREWTKDRLHDAIDKHIGAGDWTFTYLGTQPETWDDAAAVGMAAGSSSTYQPHMASAAYTATAGAVSNLAKSAESNSPNLLSDERYMDRGVAMRAGMDVSGGSGPHTPSVRPSPSPGRTTTTKPKKTGRWR